MQGIGIGESDFKMLRRKDYYFIDKSLFILNVYKRIIFINMILIFQMKV